MRFHYTPVTAESDGDFLVAQMSPHGERYLGRVWRHRQKKWRCTKDSYLYRSRAMAARALLG